MNDPLEIELGTLRPTMSRPAVRQRIADRLASPSLTWRHVAVLLGGSMAAGLAVLLAWPRSQPLEQQNNDPAALRPQARTGSPPTLADYRRALDASSAALDELLSKHGATASLRSQPHDLQAGARFNSSLLDTLGEP